jgi:hypothetical protein
MIFCGAAWIAMKWRLLAATKPTPSWKVPNTYLEGAVIGANLVATAARTQKTHADNRQEGRLPHESDSTGKLGSATAFSKELSYSRTVQRRGVRSVSDASSTLVKLFCSLATNLRKMRLQSGCWLYLEWWLCAQPFTDLGQRRPPEECRQTGLPPSRN